MERKFHLMVKLYCFLYWGVGGVGKINKSISKKRSDLDIYFSVCMFSKHSGEDSTYK